jgi:hypothetical protein
MKPQLGIISLGHIDTTPGEHHLAPDGEITKREYWQQLADALSVQSPNFDRGLAQQLATLKRMLACGAATVGGPYRDVLTTFLSRNA